MYLSVYKLDSYTNAIDALIHQGLKKIRELPNEDISINMLEKQDSLSEEFQFILDTSVELIKHTNSCKYNFVITDEIGLPLYEYINNTWVDVIATHLRKKLDILNLVRWIKNQVITLDCLNAPSNYYKFIFQYLDLLYKKVETL